MKADFSALLRSFRQRAKDLKEECSTKSNYAENSGGRSWESYYRRRWQHDKVVRSTHGVNCTGSCSFDVFVKDGIIVWETQNADYPTPHPDFPDYEPRGCPRGSCASWYVYSPLRVKYPYVRGTLLRLWRAALSATGDPVLAWAQIQNNPEARRSYQQARGKGDFMRASWDEVSELMAAALIHTIQTKGPDRIFGFTPLPAMSMTSFASGARFLNLIGASMISFYDWYCDLPPASPQIWGEQTDVCESADWYNAGYLMCWGSNLPQTRTPDAHFYSECRYRGTRIAAISPDYADFTKFADHWLAVRPGMDGALAVAMVHVVLQEFFQNRRVPYFVDYAQRFTDLPNMVMIDVVSGEDEVSGEGEARSQLVPGRFVRASDIDPNRYPNNPEWKLAVFDANTNAPAVPKGSIGARYGESGNWNLKMEDCVSNAPINPVLSFADMDDGNVTWQDLTFPVLHEEAMSSRTGRVPVRRIMLNGKECCVTTVLDLLMANLSVPRESAENIYDKPNVYGTPAWQEAFTGVPAEDVIRVAQEFAANAEETNGRSLIVMGAGINHWFHNDSIYRSIIALTTLCGCQGVNGGGWAHYVGQEKVRPLSGWAALTMAKDWLGPPRLQNGTSFYYFATDSWRFERVNMRDLCPPHETAIPAHPADCNSLAARLGWMPFYPQFKENPLEICRKARENGATTPEEIVHNTVERLKSGDLAMSVDDPDHSDNVPRVMIFWRANPLGSNVKGHEYFLRYLLGTQDSVLGEETPFRPESFPDNSLEEGGKLDLMVTSEIRMSTSCVYSDVVLPAAHWYEYNDLSSTDMHPFIHPFNAATDPPWEARGNWAQFRTLAETFSRLAEKHLGVQEDLVSTALEHDTANEIGQPFGQVHDWRAGEVEAVPGKTMFNMKVVERRYPDVLRMYSSLGPNVRKPGGVGAKGVSWSCEHEHEILKARLGVVEEEGISKGLPRIDTDKDACEVVLALSPETNGEVGVRSWVGLEKQTGMSLSDLSKPVEDIHLTFSAISTRPTRTFTSPNWSGIEEHGRLYTPFALNVGRLVPFHTLSGRQHFYLDHDWMRAMGEGLMQFRPPLPLARLGELGKELTGKGKELVLNFLSPHSKWSIHSSYSDILILRTLSRGGGEIWINDDDAASAAIADNDWLECCNTNGVFMGRAVVSHRIPKGRAFIYHAQERCINVPLSPRSGTRGGTHNSLTRALIKPTQLLGGYAQLCYSFNYYGPTGCQRDEYIVVRKAGEVRFHED